MTLLMAMEAANEFYQYDTDPSWYTVVVFDIMDKTL